MLRIRYNAPVTLTFALVAVMVFLANEHFSPSLIKDLFTLVGRDAAHEGLRAFSFNDPVTYIQLFTYIFGHESLQHLISNLTIILLLGPLIEERYGSPSLALMILVTAILNGLINVLFFPSSLLMGASGIAFMLIVLSSFSNVRRGDFPLTFVFIAAIFIWQELSTFVVHSNVSQISHLMGGICGAVFGFAITAFRSKRGGPGPQQP